MADGSSARAGGWGGWGVGGRDRRRPALERENGVRPHIDLNPVSEAKLTRPSALLMSSSCATAAAAAAAAAAAYDDEDAAIAAVANIDIDLLLIAWFDDVEDSNRIDDLSPRLDLRAPFFASALDGDFTRTLYECKRICSYGRWWWWWCV